MRQLYSVKEGPLRNHVQPRKQGESFVQHGTHDVAVAGGAEEFQRQQETRIAQPAGSIFEPGKPDLAQDRVERSIVAEPRQEQEQPAEIGA